MEEEKLYEERVEPAIHEQRVETHFQENLPNAGLVLTLGILSIPFCCCFPVGLPLGIIAWVLGTKGKSAYDRELSKYTRSSYSNLNAGRICGIVGVVMTVLYLVYTFYQINAMGGWDVYMETIREATEQYQ